MVRNLYHGTHAKGQYTRIWDGKTHEGFDVPSGAYFLRFRSKLRQFQTKFLVVK
jgi:hypothetical protein